MSSFLRPKIIALLLTQSLVFSAHLPAQDVRQQTRPRRVGDTRTQAPPADTQARPAPNEPATPARDATDRAADAGATETAPTEFVFPEPTTTNVMSHAERLDAEPTVRVALATNARSVNVSSAGTLLYATDASAPPAPLGVARVRVEARSYPAPPAARDETLAGTDSQTPRRRTNDAADSARTSAPGGSRSDAARANNPPASRAARPSNNSAATRAASSNPTASNNPRADNTVAGRAANSRAPGVIRPTSRVTPAVRGAAIYASGATPLAEVRAPVVFAPADSQAPVKLNERAYRGRLEVFANTRGTLTVVNVLGLEDYVRGVVPNELSPGGWPAVEALKAQAVAARTYVVRHRGQYAAEGYDVLPTTRSQVYGGLTTEHPLTDRAVAETRGRILTYRGEVVDALYTSTCGGRTEHAENIFGGPAPAYLRARSCPLNDDDDDHEAFDSYVVKTSRDPAALRDAEHATSARDAALLLTHDFKLTPARLTDEWLAAPLAAEEARVIVEGAAQLARQRIPLSNADTTRPPAFATAIAEAVDGERRGDVLLNPSDVQYLLAFRDADEIPARNRADVALLLREGHLSLYPDATLRPRQPLTRARALRTAARLLEARGLFRLQKATARQSEKGALVLRPTSGRGADRTLNVNSEAYIFRAFGDALYAVREVALVGGEPVAYHTDARGEVDYLEVRPAPGGASAERFSPFTNWTATLTPSEVSNRLARYARGTGALQDLRVVARGASRRVLNLEIVGTSGTASVRGGRIRSALGLREQLFVIERRYDDAGRVSAFVFKGRGWGHGVGMCQVGAYGLARAGLSHEKILKWYYTGVELTKLY